MCIGATTVALAIGNQPLPPPSPVCFFWELVLPQEQNNMRCVSLDASSGNWFFRNSKTK